MGSIDDVPGLRRRVGAVLGSEREGLRTRYVAVAKDVDGPSLLEYVIEVFDFTEFLSARRASWVLIFAKQGAEYVQE